MPLLSPDDEQMGLPDQRGAIPQAQSQTDPDSSLDLAAAVERRANLAGTLYERYSNPKPDESPVPGFDPEVSVPKGAEDHAEIFANATGPLDIQWREQQYQREQADNRIIQAHGGWGVAATMAAGLTDPVSLASMAIPVAGETRLVQAGRMAIAAGATTAAQEAAMQELEVSRTAKESALNVAAGTVLGGVLGAVIRPHVPAREFNPMADAYHAELHGDATTENVMGPIDGRQRIIPETDVPPIPPHPDSGLPTEMAAHSEYEGAAGQVDQAGSAEPPELPELLKRNTKTPDAREDSILQYLAKHPEGLSSVEAEAQGIDKASFTDPTATVGIKRAFRKNGMSFDQAAEALHEQGYPVADERGKYSPNVLLDRISDELGGTPQHSSLNTRAELEAAHEKVYDDQMRASLHEAAPEFAHEDQATQDFTTLAARAHEHDPEAVEALLRSGSDAENSEKLRAIVDEGTARQLREYEVAKGAEVHSEAEGSQGSVGGRSNVEAGTARPASSGETRSVGNNERGQPTAAEGRGAGRAAGDARLAAAPEPAKTEIPLGVANDLHVNLSGESTVGAAAATPELRGEAIARGAQTITNLTKRISPSAWLMNSPSVESRRLIQDLANVPETLTKNYSGIATSSPVERELWKYDGVHYQAKAARTKQFRAYRERLAGAGVARAERMKRPEFDQEIAKAMRRGDAHSIPEVAKAAKDTRAIGWEPLKKEAIKYNLLPEDVKVTGADSYLMRQYDTDKIKANFTDWTDRLKRGFQAEGHDPAEAADLAHSVTRNIQGSERGTMDWEALGGWRPKDEMPTSGQLKERSLKLPDTLLEPYLNNNLDHLEHSYHRSLAPQVEMERAGLGKQDTGKGTLSGRMQDLKDDYARMIERAQSDTEKKSLYNHMEGDIKRLTAVQGRLYGIYGQPKDPSSFFIRAGRLLRTENVSRLLGAATLAHFPDVANVMMRFGLPQSFAAIGKILTSPEALSLTRSESKRMGAGLDMAMSAKASSMIGEFADTGQHLEQRIGQYISRKLTVLTGETPLITAMQQWASTLAQDQLVRTAQKSAAGKAVNSNILARMASAGIDRDMLARIAEQHQQFGAKVNGLHFGMSDKWADQEVARVFESAVIRDAHSVTLRPGVGDTPMFISTEWGKALRQFTTFAFAAQRSVIDPLAQGLAHGDPRAALGLLTCLTMGTLSYVTKQMAADQPIEPFDSPRFALEVLDKSNLMAWTSDLVFPALWMMGMKNLSRWSDRDPIETIGGPSAGTVMSIYQHQLPAKFLASAGINDDQNKGISRADLHFMRRLMPGQNIWYLRNHINALEDAMGDAFDLPGKSNADRASETAMNAQ